VLGNNVGIGTPEELATYGEAANAPDFRDTRFLEEEDRGAARTNEDKIRRV
jgi:hypothetical protein